jgi:hypothetical protein
MQIQGTMFTLPVESQKFTHKILHIKTTRLLMIYLTVSS